jgi:hypothetical protein
MKIISVIISVVLIQINDGMSQETRLIKLADLPPILVESSGLEFTALDNVWTIVDSKRTFLYNINKEGNIVRAIYLNNRNTDWEDLSQDDEGNFYIGDFGNNLNKRNDLLIYKIPPPDSISEKIVNCEIISFQYPDQHDFPPTPRDKNFDMEAMVCYGNSIYLFSKNQTKPYTAYSKMYRLPNTAGHYTAVLVDSVYLGPGHQYNSWVTGADLSPDKKTLALLTHDKVWLFSCFNGDSFFNGKKKTIELNHFSQKEGICFVDNETLLLSDERTHDVFGGCLYELKLNKDEHANCK